MSDMSEQNFTKKEIYEFNKGAGRKEQASIHKRRKARKVLMWGGFSIVLIAAVWSLAKLSNKPTEIQGRTAGQIVSVSVTAEDWVKGNKESKVMLIEYGDFQCPACGAYFPLVEKLLDEQGAALQFAYRHFPLQQHANAKPAAYAAEAAGNQGKFWEMYDIIFAHQKDWSEKRNAEDVFLQYAGSLGLDLERFKQDSNSQEVKNRIESGYKSGIYNKVDSTPTFFLNGKKIQPRNYEEFLSLIKQAGSPEK